MPNTTDQGGQGTQGQKFVERFEMAIMQYVILDKAQKGEVTRENLQQTFRGNMQMSKDHFDHCIRTLVSENHLKESGGKYTITDDGREDVQKLSTLVLEIPNVVSKGGQDRRSQPQPQTVGAQGGSAPSTPPSGRGGSTVPQGGSAGGAQQGRPDQGRQGQGNSPR